jgi:nucleoside-diphosphate-sugar epimerase
VTKTVVVTGGNGRVGRGVLAYLNEEGYRTVNLSRGKRDEKHSDVYLRTDLVDAGDVYSSLGKSDADAVVHLGMIPTPDETPGYRTYESNVMSSYHVLEAAGAYGIDTVVLASSFSAVGGGFEPERITVDYLPLDESHRLTPSNPYGLGKQSLEIAADGFARRVENRPRTILSLRFPWVVDDSVACETFVEADRTLEGMRNSDHFHTQRNTLFTYVHLSDAVELVRLAAESTVRGHERFWVSAPDTSAETPTRELITEVFPDVEVRNALGDDDYTSLVDTGKAREVLGWEPEWSWRQVA